MPVPYVLLTLFGLLLLLLLFRALHFRPSKPITDAVPLPMPEDPEAIAHKMAAAVRIPTISMTADKPERARAFLALHAELERLFPLFHASTEKTVVNGYSLVYRWKGKTEKSPALIMAHQDVVPVEAGTEGDWTHGPFSGDIADGYVWGRGTLDIKSHLVCAMEAAEWLMREGHVPEHDFWFAFGHDEEIGGRDGASVMVSWFQEKGIRFSWLLDEGGVVNDGALPGVARPLALVGVGEKGFANIRFTARDAGGHASMPPRNTALGKISTFLCRLERDPMPTRLVPPVRVFLDKVGREMSFGLRFILANLWLFEPIFRVAFSAGRTGNAMLRTTAAPTVARAGDAMNVLPQQAEAGVNFRLLHGDTKETLLAHLEKAGGGLDLEMDILQLDEPSGISSTRHPAWDRMMAGIGRLYPEALAVPYLMMGATDARKYESVSDNQYRFTAYRIDMEDIRRIHGTDERISVDNLNRCVAFFRHMMETSPVI